jgi:uncharacterized alkaline shock family protein YloU
MNHDRNTNWRHHIYEPHRSDSTTRTHSNRFIGNCPQRRECNKGKTSIANGVVAKIVGIAAREIDGVHDVVGTGAGATIGGLASRVTRSDTRAQGVSVEVGEREAAASITIIAVYGVSIPQVADAVRRNIIDRVEAMTGLTVIAVDISVTDLYFEEDDVPEEQTPRVQ